MTPPQWSAYNTTGNPTANGMTNKNKALWCSAIPLDLANLFNPPNTTVLQIRIRFRIRFHHDGPYLLTIYGLTCIVESWFSTGRPGPIIPIFDITSLTTYDYADDMVMMMVMMMIVGGEHEHNCTIWDDRYIDNRILVNGFLYYY